MSDLAPEQVAALANAAGLPILPEDLEQITHRYNALLSILTPLQEMAGEPFIAPPLPEKRSLKGSPAPSSFPLRERAGLKAREGAMSEAELVHRPMTELAQLIKSREVSPVEVVEAYLNQIERQADLHVYVTVLGEQALREARP